MKNRCDKCKKVDTVFYIQPGGVYLCQECRRKERGIKKELREE